MCKLSMKNVLIPIPLFLHFCGIVSFVLVRVFVNITTSKFEAKRPKFKTLVIYVVLNCDFCGHCLHTKLKKLNSVVFDSPLSGGCVSEV